MATEETTPSKRKKDITPEDVDPDKKPKMSEDNESAVETKTNEVAEETSAAAPLPSVAAPPTGGEEKHAATIDDAGMPKTSAKEDEEEITPYNEASNVVSSEVAAKTEESLDQSSTAIVADEQGEGAASKLTDEAIVTEAEDMDDVPPKGFLSLLKQENSWLRVFLRIVTLALLGMLFLHEHETHEANLEQLAIDHKSATSQLITEHQLHIEKLESDHKAKVADVKEKLSGAYKTQVGRVKAQLESDHQSQLNLLQEEHKKKTDETVERLLTQLRSRATEAAATSQKVLGLEKQITELHSESLRWKEMAVRANTELAAALQTAKGV